MGTQVLVAAKPVCFHKVDYVVNISLLNGDLLVIEIEEKDVGDKWKGQFSAKYIEEITQKTGNFKKFSVFVKMLTASLAEASDTVHIDLLTYDDLETMKRTARPGSINGVPPQAKNKRYLILTYAVEFDRVHYPLPLAFQATSSVDELKSTIRRLQEEIVVLTRNKDSGRDEWENQCKQLSAIIAAQAKELDMLREKIPDEHSIELMRSRITKAEETLAEEREAHRRVISHKNRDYSILAEELEKVKDACRRLREEQAKSRGARPPSASRFDPTAYVRDRNTKRSSVERQHPSPSSRPLSAERTRASRTPSVERPISRPSSVERVHTRHSSSVERSRPARPSSAERGRNSRSSSVERGRSSRTPSVERSRPSSVERSRTAEHRNAARHRPPSSDKNRAPVSRIISERQKPHVRLSSEKIRQKAEVIMTHTRAGVVDKGAVHKKSLGKTVDRPSGPGSTQAARQAGNLHNLSPWDSELDDVAIVHNRVRGSNWDISDNEVNSGLKHEMQNRRPHSRQNPGGSRAVLALSDSSSHSDSDGSPNYPNIHDGKGATEISKRLSALQSYLFAQRHKNNSRDIG